MLSVELVNLANMLDSAKLGHNFSAQARSYSKIITDAIWNTTVCSNPLPFIRALAQFVTLAQVVDNIFAYETNGPPSSPQAINNI